MIDGLSSGKGRVGLFAALTSWFLALLYVVSPKVLPEGRSQLIQMGDLLARTADAVDCPTPPPEASGRTVLPLLEPDRLDPSHRLVVLLLPARWMLRDSPSPALAL